MTDLSQIKANLESVGKSVEVREMCGLSWSDPDNPEIVFTDGNEAVGELTADLGNGMIVPIPVCQRCLDLVSTEYKLSLSKE